MRRRLRASCKRSGSVRSGSQASNRQTGGRSGRHLRDDLDAPEDALHDAHLRERQIAIVGQVHDPDGEEGDQTRKDLVRREQADIAAHRCGARRRGGRGGQRRISVRPGRRGGPRGATCSWRAGCSVRIMGAIRVQGPLDSRRPQWAGTADDAIDGSAASRRRGSSPPTPVAPVGARPSIRGAGSR